MQASIIDGKFGSRMVPEGAGEAGVMADLLHDCANRNRRIFLFGGDSRSVYALRERIASAMPAVRIAGICDADFAGPVDRAVLDHIAAAHADVIVTDLPETRFPPFCAQCAGMGISATRINLPGSFAAFAFGRRRRGLLRLAVPARLRRFGAAARAGLRFACIVLRQSLSRAGPARASVLPPRRRGQG
ncbi:MAG: hypothetical protein EOP23_09280 [Hyphomicrobiales bacterium]|nr:MAG: hypothetical protein EOP23_09280 [Hyphomicrobiales bacterium]